MKFIQNLTIILGIISLTITIGRSKKLSKSERNLHKSIAFLDIINELFRRHEIHFDAIIYGNTSCQTSDILSFLKMDDFAKKI